MKTKFLFLTLVFATLIMACNSLKKKNENEKEATTEEALRSENLKSVLVKGILLNSENDKPISMAMVFVVGTKTGTMTGQDGKFQILAPAGARQIGFSTNGFEGKKVDIDAEKEMIVKLKPKTE